MMRQYSAMRRMRIPQHTHKLFAPIPNPQKTRLVHWILIILFLGALYGLTTGCEQEEVSTEEVARPIKMFIVQGNAGEESYEYLGKISPDQESRMAFEVDGRIVKFPADEGHRVRKGTILAKLDARDYQAEFDKEIARVRETKAEYERQAALYEARNTSLAELQVAQRKFEVRKARARQARKALQDTVLRAPFAGRVAKKLVKDFQNVQAKEPVLILQDVSTLEVVVQIPEQDWVNVKPNLTFEELKEQVTQIKPLLEVSSIPNRRFPTWMKKFATMADPVTRTFEVTFSFKPPPDLSIHPGMTAKVVMRSSGDAGTSGGLKIPSSAVVSDEGGEPMFWLVSPDMIVKKQPVTMASFSGQTQIAIKSGLSPGDTIALSGVHHLRAGMKVRRLETTAR